MGKRLPCPEWVQPVLAFEMSVRSPHEELDLHNNRLVGTKKRNVRDPVFDLCLESFHVKKPISAKPWPCLGFRNPF